MPKINFIAEDVSLLFFKEKEKTRKWINDIIVSHGAKPVEINYIFCSDEYILKVNKEYLDHDYYTDIITFDNSEEEGKLESDIFISVDRIKDNANTLQEPFEKEFHRVLIHGILHLLGYDDKDEKEKNKMRLKENECLAILFT